MAIEKEKTNPRWKIYFKSYSKKKTEPFGKCLYCFKELTKDFFEDFLGRRFCSENHFFSYMKDRDPRVIQIQKNILIHSPRS